MNILSGNGEHVLHIVAQSKAIWMSNQTESEGYVKRSPIKRTTNSQVIPEIETSVITFIYRKRDFI